MAAIGYKKFETVCFTWTLFFHSHILTLCFIYCKQKVWIQSFVPPPPKKKIKITYRMNVTQSFHFGRSCQMRWHKPAKEIKRAKSNRVNPLEEKYRIIF
jgi:hypothetical protein